MKERTAQIIAICGGSGSGKSTLARKFVGAAQLTTDHFYKNLDLLTPRRGRQFRLRSSLDRRPRRVRGRLPGAGKGRGRDDTGLRHAQLHKNGNSIGSRSKKRLSGN